MILSGLPSFSAVGGLMRISLLILLTMFLATPALGSAQPEDLFGIWLTEGGSAKLEIFPCGDKACGKVVWLKHPNYVNNSDGPVGMEKVDRKNSDPALRNRPIVGLKVMEGLSLEGEWWRNGSCYDPQSGNTYQCKMRLESPSELRLRGFIGISLLGRTYTLNREQSSQIKTANNRVTKNSFH
jgi:uncharacterized protein (DUF2147 family)